MVSKYYIDPGKHVRAQQAQAQKIGGGCLHARKCSNASKQAPTSNLQIHKDLRQWIDGQLS